MRIVKLMNSRDRLFAVALLMTGVFPLAGQSETMQEDAHSGRGMDHSAMQHMDHGDMQKSSQEAEHDIDHSSHEQSEMVEQNHNTMPEMNHDHHATMPAATKHSGQTMNHANMNDNNMSDMNHGTMQGGSAPADARDPHAYSGGYTLSSGPYALSDARQLHMADEHNFASLLVDRLEAVRSSDNTSAAFDLQAWYGRDYNRLVLKSEGHYDNKEIEEASTELLWGHAIAAYWNSQLGLRYDSGEGPDRSWLAFGVQGLAPYWFEIDATAYVGEEGRTALNLEAEYELLITQKLILQPRIEADFYGKADNKRGIGSGLSELKTGLRLRYEIRREFAPYVGVEWAGKFADTADMARAVGQDTSETQAVAGLRFWF